jgi:hypothetical protein
MRRGSKDHDWRLEFELAVGSHPDRLYGRLRDSLEDEIVLTHKGARFYAYAASEQQLRSARAFVDVVTYEHGLARPAKISGWEPELLIWRQIDPPISDQEARAQSRRAAAEREREPESRLNGPSAQRTVAALVGGPLRQPFEAEMLQLAASLGLGCEIVEHPHLLTTQVLFNLMGARRDIQSFESQLNRVARATMRVDPGLIPPGAS